jgi:hypothetical protein
VILPEAPAVSPRPAVAAQPLSPGPPDASEPMQTVIAWAKAWSEQRVEDYLSFYGSAFQPPGGTSRAAWEEQRRQRISTPSRIDVKVALRDVRFVTPAEVEIDFLQSYSSDRFSDVVVKTLQLVLESGVWKIARESTG